jgi:hypothetical protein
MYSITAVSLDRALQELVQEEDVASVVSDNRVKWLWKRDSKKQDTSFMVYTKIL